MRRVETPPRSVHICGSSAWACPPGRHPIPRTRLCKPPLRAGHRNRSVAWRWLPPGFRRKYLVKSTLLPGPVNGVRYEKPAIAPKLCVFAARDHCPPRSNRTFIRVEYVGKIAEIVACHGDHAVILGYLRPAPILAASHIVVAAQKQGLPVYSRPGPRCFDR